MIVMFLLSKNYYSVPYSYVGKEVEIEVGKGVVRIYYNQTLIATHVHLIGKGEFVLRQVIILNINACLLRSFKKNIK